MNPHPGFRHARAARLRLLGAALLLTTLLGPRAAAQTSNTDGATPPGLAPGAPAGSYALSGFEHVNLFNGHLNFRLPLLGVRGRGGAQHTVTLPLEQHWRVERSPDGSTNEGYYYPSHNAWYDVRPGYGPGVLLSRTAEQGDQECWSTYEHVPRYELTRLTFVAPDGTEYELLDKETGGRPLPITDPCLVTVASRGGVWTTPDGQSLTFIADPDPGSAGYDLRKGYLLFRDGTRYRIENEVVAWLRDRNGNKVSFTYDQSRRVKTITDSLDRVVTIEYDFADAAPYGTCDRIRYRGFGGQERIIRVSKAQLSTRLRPDSGYVIKTTAELFDNGFGGDPYAAQPFDAGITSAVWLPDGRSYQFYYNEYAELARVVLPTGGAFEYDYAAGVADGPAGGLWWPDIYRRVVERRVYAGGGTGAAFDYKMTYSRPESQAGTEGFVLVEHEKAGGAVLSQDKHYFYGSVAFSPYRAGYLSDTPGITYGTWDGGREYQTEALDAAGAVLRRVEHTWQQRAPVSWWGWWLREGYANAISPPEPANDPRVVTTVTTVEPDGANLVTKQTAINPQTGAASFDQFNNPTDVFEYDFGVGAAGTFLRRTHTDYVEAAAYVNASADPARGAHLRALVSQHWVSSDAAGANKVSLTSYEYDNYAADSYHAGLVGRPGITGLCTTYDAAGVCFNPEAVPALAHTAYINRGNVTATFRHLLADAGSAAGSIAAYAQYDVAGNVVKSIDPTGNVSEVGYADSFCNNNNGCGDTFTPNASAFPTSTTSPVPQPDPAVPYGAHQALVTTTKYDFWTGLVHSTTDPNDQTTRAEYDPADELDRLKAVVRPDGGRTDYEYGDQAGGLFVRVRADLAAGRRTESRQFFDGLGRAYRRAQYENTDPAKPWVTVDTEYDALGRAWRVSLPYRAAEGAGLFSTDRWTEADYDALGRVQTITTKPDNAAVKTDYDGARVLVTDPAGKQRLSKTDALGRLVEVWEVRSPDPASGTEAVTFPGRPGVPAVTAGYRTAYRYDVLGHLRQVEQGGQVRYFAYDSLGRLVRARLPEQGVMADDPPGGDFPALTDASSGMSNSRWSVGYRYDAGGNLTKRQDARGVRATYGYDALGRNTTVEYSDLTPAVRRYYDNETSGAHGLGRLWKSEAHQTALSTVSRYDALGRPQTSSRQFWAGSGWGAAFTVGRDYGLAGHVTAQTYPSGRSVSYAYDAAGRPASFAGDLGDSAPRTYATAITYDELGGLRQEQFGTHTPLYHKRRYTVRGQLSEVRLGTGPDPESWNRGLLASHYSTAAWAEWGASGPDNNGNLLRSHYYIPHTDQSSLDDPAASTLFYQDYEYDALNRLTRVTESSNLSAAPAYAQAYDYDRWGNRTVNAAGTWAGSPDAAPSALVNEQQFAGGDLAATNRLHAVGDLDAGRGEAQRRMRYDGAGNLTQDLCHDAATLCARAYDAEGRMTQAQFLSGQVRTARYAYDADGQRVRRETVDDGEVWQIYGLDGELLAEYTPHAPAAHPRREYGYRGGELLVTAEPPPAAQARANFALAASGATAASSSTLDAGRPGAGAIDGDRAGRNWGSGGGWHDATADEFPDWLEVSFAGEQTLDEVHVFSVQDTYWSPEEPQEATAFTQYGLTDFDLEYWTGGAWQAVPGGRVRGNTRVWRRVRFAPVTTGKLRVVVHSAQAGYSRIAELEAWGPQGQPPPHLNVAAAAAGARATASSTLDGGRAAEGAINGDRAGRDWGSGGGWHDATPEEFPDWLEVSLAGPRAVGEVSVFSVQDHFLWPEEPDEHLAFTRYGVTEFDVQYWDGTGWVTAAGVTGNDRVWRRVRFAQVVTTKIRVLVRGALAGYSRIAEVEAYGAGGGGADIRWLVTDHLGTARMVVDESGSLAGVTRHDYLPFGEEIGAGVSGRTTAQGYVGSNLRQKWAQLERDGETGLDYAQNRYYSPTMGRFTSVDPENAGADENDPQSWNGYAYGLNKPTVFVDPDGLSVKICDASGACAEVSDETANSYLFNKNYQRAEGLTVKGGKIYQNGEQIGSYENLGIDGAPFSSALMEAGRYPYGKAVGAFGVASVVGGVTGGVALYYGAPAAAGTGGVLSQGRKVLQRIESAIDDILSSASKGKVSSSRQFNKPGGMSQANKDFNELTKGVKVQTRGQTRTAELENGYKVNVRPSSSGGRPTLEIQKPRGAGKDIKVRYDN